jgi:hypothetical protein
MVIRKKINKKENLEDKKDFLGSIIIVKKSDRREEKLEKTIEVILHLAKVSTI